MASGTYTDIRPIQHNEGEQVTPEHELEVVEVNRDVDGNCAAQRHDGEPMLETPRTKKRKKLLQNT